MPAENPPKYIYKIAPEAPPEPLPAVYPLSSLDAADGFIHLSEASQIAGTCGLFFGSFTDLWILKVEVSRVQDPVKWEGGFPHLYGDLSAQIIVDSKKFERPEGKSWQDIMTVGTWLE